jgi:hypothetical protein
MVRWQPHWSSRAHARTREDHVGGRAARADASARTTCGMGRPPQTTGSSRGPFAALARVRGARGSVGLPRPRATRARRPRLRLGRRGGCPPQPWATREEAFERRTASIARVRVRRVRASLSARTRQPQRLALAEPIGAGGGVENFGHSTANGRSYEQHGDRKRSKRDRTRRRHLKRDIPG